MKKNTAFLIAITPILLPCVFAAPPTSGAYVTDPQSEYTADQATREVSNPSQILCFISNTRPDAMVNRGTYVALIDGVKCDNEGMTDSSKSTAAGSTGTVSYSSVSATSTRSTSSSPQIAKGHVDLKEDDMRMPVYFHMTQSEAASESAPNGVLTFNYALALADNTTVNGITLPAGSMVVRGRFLPQPRASNMPRSAVWVPVKQTMRVCMSALRVAPARGQLRRITTVRRMTPAMCLGSTRRTFVAQEPREGSLSLNDALNAARWMPSNRFGATGCITPTDPVLI